MMKNIYVACLLAVFSTCKLMADPLSTHGMLLFGQRVDYASHLPMFHKPHNYQVILKLKLEELDEKHTTVMTYKKMKQTQDQIFTLVPELLDLSKIIDGSKKSFRAQLYLGHFERSGKNLGPVRVHIKKLVYSKKLKKAEQSRDPQFLAFGERGEYYGAHIIKGSPSYDAIYSIKTPQELGPCSLRWCPPPNNRWPVLEKDLPLVITHTNLSSLKIPKAGEQLGIFSDKVTALIKRVIYVESDELKG